MRQLNDDSLAKLNVLAALSKMVRSDNSIDAYQNLAFPSLCILLRDFDLDITESGYECLDDWMEAVLDGQADGKVLDTESTVTEQVQMAIKNDFPDRRMLSMEPPAKQDKQFLKRIANGGETGVMCEGDFKQGFLSVASTLLKVAAKHPKKVDGKLLDGAGLCDLVRRVVAGSNGTDINVDMGARSITRGEFEDIYLEWMAELQHLSEQLEITLPMLSFEVEHKLRNNGQRIMQNYKDELEKTGLIDPTLKREYHNKMWDLIMDRHSVVISTNTRLSLKERARLTANAENQLRRHLAELDEKMSREEFASFKDYVDEHNTMTETGLELLESKLKLFCTSEATKTEVEKLNTVAEGHLLAHKADQREGLPWRLSETEVPSMGDEPHRGGRRDSNMRGTELAPIDMRSGHRDAGSPSRMTMQKVPSRQELVEKEEQENAGCCRKCVLM
eukprot:TRINITY_DN24083_c0_g1_i2.p1 TRINITY_DN24083_c0_g1~~TRINITY_DN24083_c0_g1_i2.p1  ORF type:complete len:446 (-),score=133.68 TRINITY_DN24083_c0_g1_i2:448-1785(-)